MKRSILRTQEEVANGVIVTLTFDKPDSAANIVDRALLDQLEEELALIETTPSVAGVIFTSAKEAIFLAGADLALLERGTTHPELLDEYLKMGQRLFNQIAGLTIPTVAAIHGACVGGGYELALACDSRIASDDARTRIGLPETKLGILPAWGGSTRLPRLIGIPRALDLILGGKTPSAKQALRLGMIDEVVPREWLLKAAMQRLQGSGAKRQTGGLFRRISQRVIGAGAARQALPALMKKTRGNYPALLKALGVVSRAWDERDLFASQARERKAVTELVSIPECRNLFHVYLLQERARRLAKHATDGFSLAKIESVAVIGAGVMGSGIAQWLSAKGVRVLLRDLDAVRVGAGMERIFKLNDEAVRRHLMTRQQARDATDRISPAPFDAPLANVQMVIEAAVEKLDLKKKIFEGIDCGANPKALLATNTSALPVGEIAAAAKQHSGRVLGIHFFNPVHRMPLVELVVPNGAAPEARAEALHFIQQIGKFPVVVHDTPGFLVNRVLLPYLMEAAEAFNAGLSATAIDEAMLGFGMPMGPLQLVDEVGLDVALDVAQTLSAAYPDRMEVPEILVKMVEKGWLGRKTGEGFYCNGSPNPTAVMLRSGAHDLPEIDAARERMIYRMVDESVRCLADGVVEAPEDVDFGMVMGTGFPPFRGGPLRYADAIGVVRLVKEMEALKLKPCDRLCEMAANAKRFYEDEYRE